MKVLLIGGGEIGHELASALHQQHDVTVMDQAESQAGAFETLDVRFMRGNGADPEDLKDAGADGMDAVLACTANDDVNVLSCLAAKGLGAARTMAFVSRQRYLDAFHEGGAMSSVGLSIDRVLWPQRTLARQIAGIVQVPRALDSTRLADGKLEMLEFRLDAGDPYIGEPLRASNTPSGALMVGHIREDRFTVPSGDTVPCEGDKLVFMGTPDGMRAIEGMFSPRKRQIRVAILGGGNVGFMVAERLQAIHARIAIIESDEARCEKLAQLLPNALVLQGDGTDLELMEQERLDDSDVVVAVTNDDGKNLLASLLAKQLGIPKVITRVGRARNRRIFERVGIDSPLTHRAAAVQEALNWLKVDQVEHLASIEDRAEVMEVTYPESCAGGRIDEVGSPQNALIGAIKRGRKVVVPTGSSRLEPNDQLFIVTTPDNVPAVQAWLDSRRGPN